MSRVCAVTSRFAGFSAAAFLALLASGSVCATELYKWTDSKGVVHYSDTPPPTGADAAQRLRLNGTESPKNDSTEEKPAAANPETDANKPPAPAALPDTPEGRARLCEQARAQVDLLQSKFQVADSSGKPLDDKTRAARTVEAKQAVTSYCQNPG
jgi:hypothetical protein